MPRDAAAILTGAVRTLLLRDLESLQRELDSYPSDEQIWQVAPGIGNSAGTLALHMAGNLRHFLGAVLGGSGYVRDRDAEFSRRDVSREELRREIEAAMQSVDATVPALTESDIESPYPIRIAGRRIRTADFLMHLVAHLTYHLGQVDYHRRLLTGGGALQIVSPTELPALDD